MTTWHKRDWQQFYELARRPWQRHRPPRPVYPTGLNRVLPAQGFSLSELDDAGVDLDLAERLGSVPMAPTSRCCAILCALPASRCSRFIALLHSHMCPFWTSRRAGGGRYTTFPTEA